MKLRREEEGPLSQGRKDAPHSLYIGLARKCLENNLHLATFFGRGDG
jgi:hypothetical protein